MGEASAMELFKLVHDAIRKRADTEVRDWGLTATQSICLFSIRDAGPSGIAMGDLVTRLGVAQPTASGIVSRLEKRELVRSVENPADRRAKIAELTPAGREHCKYGQDFVASTFEGALSDDEWRQLSALLEKLREFLDT